MLRLLTAALAAVVVAPVSAATLSLELPATADGADFRAFDADRAVVERALTGHGRVSVELGTLPAGTYRFELQPRVAVPAAQRRASLPLRGNGERPSNWPTPLAYQSGVFVVDANGAYVFDAEQASRRDPGTTPGKTARAKDQVIPDDVIAQGSICAGFDCVNNESFGFDTIRLKENNTRLAFDDTSTTAGVPFNDWRLIANDNATPYAYFAIEDSTANRVPFRVEAGAIANALVVKNNGNLGIGEPNPTAEVHVTSPDTPVVRLAQSNAGGFTAQTWDVGGNEANFFIRDATGGSQLSFRIRPGAPTSSLDIGATGNLGVGTATPGAALDLRRPVAGITPLLRAQVLVGDNPATVDVEDDFSVTRLQLDASGDLYVGGTISQLSSRKTKENFVAVEDRDVLSRIEKLPIASWNYIAQPDADRHLGPTAEDFHAAFGLGESDTRLAPGDVAGVALAATRALKHEIEAKDAKIAELEARLARLEALLEKPVATN